MKNSTQRNIDSEVDMEHGFRDALTGVYTRAFLHERLAEEIRRSRRSNEPFCLMMMDIDHFKSINDAFGHARGDEALIEFTHRLLETARESDLIFRYGGDEFIILLPRITKEQATGLARRLIDRVRNEPFAGTPPLSISMSVGIACFPEDSQEIPEDKNIKGEPPPLFDETIQHLVETADQRQYHAKRSGRATVVDEDVTNTTIPTLEEPGRLIEREVGLDTLNNFLRLLPERRRATLRVAGPTGTGRSRFLAEAANQSRLQGLLVVELNARPVLQNRHFGALVEGLIHAGLYNPSGIPSRLPHPAAGAAYFVDDLTRASSLPAALVFILDDPQYSDAATLDFLQDVLDLDEEFAPFPIAVISSLDIPLQGTTRQRKTGTLRSGIWRETIEIKALSREGVRIWVRHAMQWEAPEEFLTWLFEASGGKPRLLRDALALLVVSDVFTYTHTGNWKLNANALEEFSLAEELAEAASRSMPQIRLPGGVSPLVGREPELIAIGDLLRRERLVTINGADGMGKTRLAIQVAAEFGTREDTSLTSGPTDGMFFVSLAGVAHGSTAQLATAIANTIGFSFPSGAQRETSDPAGQIIAYLRRRSVLLLMDSFEHLLPNNDTDAETVPLSNGVTGTPPMDALTFISELLAQAPGVRLLITSNSRLDLPGEATYAISGLPYPPQEDELKLPVESYSSVQLFIQRSQRVNPEFVLTSNEKPFAAKICRLVDGMPLGIELAAAWVKTFSCEQISQQIENNLNFIDQASAKDRSITSLQAMFDSFWKLLFKGERSSLRRLSVFSGSFSGTAAGEIALASPFFMDALVMKSFLQKSRRGRYQIHEILKQYSAERLHNIPTEEKMARDQHSRYYFEFLAVRASQLDGGEHQRSALEEIGLEIENIRTAWEWRSERLAASLASSSKTTALLNAHNFELFSKAMECLFYFYYMRSWFKEGEEAFNHLTNLLVKQNLESSFEGRFIYAKSLVSEGWFAFLTGHYGHARDLMGTGLTHLRNLKNIKPSYRQEHVLRALSFGLNYYGAIHRHLTEYEEAKRLLYESLGYCKITGDRFGSSIALNILGQIATAEGNLGEVESIFQRALEIKQEIGDRWGIAFSLEYKGQFASAHSQNEEAARLFSESLAIRQEIGDQRGVGLGLNELGTIALNSGDVAEARRLYSEALQTFKAIGDPIGTIQSLNNLGSLALDDGDHDKTSAFYHSALEIAASLTGVVESLPSVLESLTGIGWVLDREGKHEQALRLLVSTRAHPASSRKTRSLAARLVEKIVAMAAIDELPPPEQLDSLIRLADQF